MVSLGDWRKRLVTLDDETFIGLMRNYLGSVKTPFHKHALIDSLTELLRKPEFQERVISFVDNSDAEFLTAVAMLGEPTVEDLVQLFASRHRPLVCRRRIINLEERLLLVRTPKENRLVFNPMFEEAIRERILDPGILFPSRPIRRYAEEAPWISANLLLALCGFLMEWDIDDFRRTDGGLRQKFGEELSNRFPLFGDKRKRQAALGLLENLGLRSRPHAAHPALRWLSELAPEKVDEFLIAAALGGDPEESWGLVSTLIHSIPGDREFDVATFEKIVALAASRSRCSRIPSLDTLENLGVISTRDGYCAVNPHLVYPSPPGEGSLRVAGNFDLTWSGSIPFSDLLVVACSSHLVLFDRIPRFVLDKSHFLCAQEAGFGGDDLLAILGRWATVPQNVRFNVSDWLSAHRSVSLSRGILVRGSDGKEGVVESLFGDFALEHLGTGILLLDESRRAEWAPVAADLGLTVPEELGQPAQGAGEMFTAPREPAEVEINLSPSPKETRETPSGSDLEDKLATLDVAASQRDDILERIQRKVVIHPDQISPALAGRESMEARGLDYGGKVRLIERAIAGGMDLLEVTTLETNGDASSETVKPVSLSRKEDGHALAALSFPDEREVFFAVRKIGRVKRLRGSFFES